MTRASRSFSTYSAGELRASSRGPKNRCPRVMRPAVRLPYRIGRISLSKRHTSHRMGRRNATPDESHRIVFLHGRERRISGISSCKTS